MLNKPIGYVTTSKDQFDRDTVMDLVKGVRERLVPVGRLDMYTSGALILTNDGEFVNRVTHPKHEIEKTYNATIVGKITESEIEKLKQGVEIDLSEKDYMERSEENSQLKSKNLKQKTEKGYKNNNERLIKTFKTSPAKVRILKIDEEKNLSRIQITIHEGKNREVRKMCEAIGKKVLALHRTKIGNIDVKDLKLGTWRHLKQREIESLLK